MDGYDKIYRYIRRLPKSVIPASKSDVEVTEIVVRLPKSVTPASKSDVKVTDFIINLLNK